MISANYAGQELEAAWVKFLSEAAPAGANADVVGIDVVAKDGDDFLVIQVKSSVFGALKHTQQSLKHGRLIPVVVGDPIGWKKEILEALRTKGFWITPSLRYTQETRDLETVYVTAQVKIVGRVSKAAARELCRI